MTTQEKDPLSVVGFKYSKLKTLETPRQKRALERVNVILEATSELLSKQPPQELNTTLIATCADIPVSSIYRYFPTLDDVLRELYLQTAGELRAKLFSLFEDTDAHPKWRDRLKAILEVQRQYLAGHQYYRPLLLRFLSARSPLAVENEEHDELVVFLEKRWAAGLDGFHHGDPKVVANATIQMALSMEDLIAAQKGVANRAAYSEELVKILESYLSRYLRD